MPIQRGQQFPITGVGEEWTQNSENINLASKNMPKTQTTPVRNMGKVGGGENTVLRMTPAPLTGGGSTIYRKLGDSEGYPRGHTPEQMREVRDVEASGNLKLDGEGHYTHSGKDEAIMRESIARSKINPKETFTEPVRIASTSTFLGARGAFYHKDSSDNTSGKHKINIKDSGNFRERAGHTLIHEIGHYVDRDAISKKNSPKNSWDKAEYAGTLEGTADTFASKNFVEDPRDTKKSKNTSNNKSLYPAYAGLAQHAVPGTDTWSWGKGYVGTGMEAAERGDSRYTELTSTVEMPGGEGARAAYEHPQTKARIPGGRMLEYMQGKDS
jgi:hypothetical protein